MRLGRRHPGRRGRWAVLTTPPARPHRPRDRTTNPHRDLTAIGPSRHRLDKPWKELGFAAKRIGMDRQLEEALNHGPDALHLAVLFDIGTAPPVPTRWIRRGSRRTSTAAPGSRSTAPCGGGTTRRPRPGPSGHGVGHGRVPGRRRAAAHGAGSGQERHRLPARDQQGSPEEGQRAGPLMTAAPADRSHPRRARTEDQSDRAGPRAAALTAVGEVRFSGGR